MVTSLWGLLNSQIRVFSFIGVYMPVFELTCMRLEFETGALNSTIFPSTLTIPYAINYSACLREHTPILASLLLNLSVYANCSMFYSDTKSSTGETCYSSFSLIGIFFCHYSSLYVFTKSSLNLSKDYNRF